MKAQPRTFTPRLTAMKPTLLTALFLLIIIAFASGCSTTETRYGKKEVNVLGIVKVEQENYGEMGPLTVGVKTSELFTRTAPSGGRVTFLWGLFTLADD